jgi:hypothetical protein
MSAEPERGRIALALTILAIAYGVGLVAWAASVSVVDGETLLQYGGPGSLMIVVQPLLLSLLMWALLRHRHTTGSSVAIAAAWVVGALYLVWSVLGALTLAAGALPAALLLLFAVALTPRPESRTAA